MAGLERVAAAVAGAHAAVYTYGLCGAHLTGAERSRALEAMASQREVRDRLAAVLSGAGASAPPAQVAYDPPVPVRDSASARRVAGLVEDRCAGLLAAAAAELTGPDRTWAATVAQQCARRQVGWTGRAPVWSGAS